MKLVIAGVILIVAGWILFIVMSCGDYERELRVQLLYRTDHQALLEACRELSTRVGKRELKPGMYRIRAARDPIVSRFPRIIVDLAPSYVVVDEDGRITVEMLGGTDHFGVKAYPRNYRKPAFADFTYGDKELCDGLWYYDDGYKELGADYEKRIEALRPRGDSGVNLE